MKNGLRTKLFGICGIVIAILAWTVDIGAGVVAAFLIVPFSLVALFSKDIDTEPVENEWVIEE